VFASLVPDPDDKNCPKEFRDTVIRLLKDKVPSPLKAYSNGKDWERDPDPYCPYDGIPDTPRNRLLTFIARWSPKKVAFDLGRDDSEPSPAEMLDARCLVKWETAAPDHPQGAEVLRIAEQLILAANNGNSPSVLDPFAGGGAIPLEVGRIGAQPIANDYNPVAHLILRATCEFPQAFGKDLARELDALTSRVMEKARTKLGHLYPCGKDGHPVVGYVWARTVRCSNPGCRAEIPLLRSLLLCNKPAKQISLVVNKRGQEITFGVAKGREIKATDGTMLNRGDCRCLFCLQTMMVSDLRKAGMDGKLGQRMVAVITDTAYGRSYRPIEPTDLRAFDEALKLAGKMEHPQERNADANDAGLRVHNYGFKTFGSLFNERQIVLMQTLVGCIRETLSEVSSECKGKQKEYYQAITVYLGLWMSRCSARYCSLTVWNKGEEKFEHPFGRQSIPMNWDYPEPNPFVEGSAGLPDGWDLMRRVLVRESMVKKPARVLLGDAARLPLADGAVDFVVTDPPYFDAIAYADLSDFFYVWLKRAIGDSLSEVFATPLAPKEQEATALKHRHGGDQEKAKTHFTKKLAASLVEAKRVCSKKGVIAVMFAHQSTEAWTALINALFEADLTVTATYPIDTELTTALKKEKSALSSSITVICRPRQAGAAASFKDVRREIEKVVAETVHRFFDIYGFRGADLIVACYGPAVGVFGKYERVEKADGSPVDVPTLLELAKEAALKAIAGEFSGDAQSRLYYVWSNLYGTSEQAWDDARLVAQVGGNSEDAMDMARQRGLFVVHGSTCRLALLKDRSGLRHLGDEADAPLIDQLHHAMRLWKAETRDGLVDYLAENELTDSAPFWKLAQALFEVLPRDIEDWKFISALLGERETLRTQAKRTRLL